MTRTNTDKADLFLHYWRAMVIPESVPPVREYRFHPTRRWRFDFAWPAANIAVEVDGGQWLERGGRHNTDGDREKLNAAAAAGWRVFRYSVQMLTVDPRSCIEQVATALDYATLPF